MDKVSFTMGVLVIVLTEFLIMRHPEWFIPYFTCFMLSLFVIRYVMYSKDKYQGCHYNSKLLCHVSTQGIAGQK